MPAALKLPRIQPIVRLPIHPWAGGLLTDLEAHDPNYPMNKHPVLSNYQILPGRVVKIPGRTVINGNTALSGQLQRMDRYEHDQAQTLMALTHTKVYAMDNNLVLNELPAAGGAALTGNTTDVFGAAVSNRKYIFSQGIDKLMVVDGGLANFSPLSADANLPAARYLFNRNGRLIAAWVKIAGNNQPYRINWSAFNNETNWSAFSSGFIDLDDTDEELEGLNAVGGNLYAFKRSTIIPGIETGIAASAYGFDERMTIGPGTVAGHSILGIHGGLVYMGPDDLYWFDGNRPQGLMMDQIRLDQVLSMNPNRFRAIHAVHDEIFQTYRLYVPTTNDTFPTRVIVWHYREFLEGKSRGQFSTEYPPSPVAASAFLPQQVGGTTIAQLIGTISQQSWRLGDAVFTSNFPVLYEGQSGGKVFKRDFSATTWGGVTISAEAHTKDFTSIDLLSQQKSGAIPSGAVDITAFRWGIYYQTATATTLKVAFSRDNGATWQNLTTLTLEATASHHHKIVFFDVIETDHEIRYRAIHDDPNASVTILGCEPQFIASTDPQT